MKAFLLHYLPRLVEGWVHEQHFLLVPHEGKSDLDKSIPRKLKSWREPGACFVVLRDNDGADCRVLKERLVALCRSSGRSALIRLVCQELEAWYLGDAAALAKAYPEATKEIQRLNRRFPDPDACLKPSRTLERSLPSFQKRDAARRLGSLLNHETNRSASLRVFSQGVQRLASPTGIEPVSHA
ncbi:MAG: DUF4276 family protein [Candidatus Accumulibacter sp.]|nr:DUF4276 family protein [Accumulibacter sp.]